MMSEAQSLAWLKVTDRFREEVEYRLADVTDVGELETLVRVLGISCDVASSISQLGMKQIELELERYRIELNARDGEVELEMEDEAERALNEDAAESGEGPK